MPQSTMPQINNVVMLMLENRSLDNLFGSLYPGPCT
jgi:phospholipase C